MSFLFRLLGRLPLRLLHALGVAAGTLAYLLSPRFRARTLENLALAYPEGIPAGLALASAREAGRGALELPWLWTRPLPAVLARVTEVEGWSAVEAAFADGGAPLLLTPHLGSFEVAGQFCGSHFPIAVLYRPPRQAALAPLMDAGRRRGQTVPAPADTGGVRTMLKYLKSGRAVGMLPDQVPQFGEGVWVPFFGRPAYTMTLAARFAELPRVTPLMIYAERRPGSRWRVVVRRLTQPLDGNPLQRVSQLNAELERAIRACPAQYLWSYNRYKRPAGVAAPPEPAQ